MDSNGNDYGPLRPIRFEFIEGNVIEALFHEVEINALRPGVPFQVRVPLGLADPRLDGAALLAGLPQAEIPLGGVIDKIRKEGDVTVVTLK